MTTSTKVQTRALFFLPRAREELHQPQTRSLLMDRIKSFRMGFLHYTIPCDRVRRGLSSIGGLMENEQEESFRQVLVFIRPFLLTLDENAAVLTDFN